jgi:N-acyl-D-aspartate/D-glutamate deacylase
MADLVRDAVRAGAIGFSTNRLASHTAKDGRPVPGTFASEEELAAIGRALADAGGGVVEIVSSEAMGMKPGGYHADVQWAARFSREFGLPVTLCLTQIDNLPDLWRDVLGWIDGARAAGADISAQVAGRPLGILLGLSTKHVFEGRKGYMEVAGLPVAERARALADPERRRRILEESETQIGVARLALRMANKAFSFDGIPNYEPSPERSIAAVAAATGRTVEEVYYDELIARDGRNLVQFYLGGYAHQNLDHIHTMLSHPHSVLGLADGGAHCGLICDASVYTTLLSHWVRDRERGPRLPLELAVAKMTNGPATLYGLNDRGVIGPGKKADLNVIDFDHLRLLPPRLVHDLPAQGRRLIQAAEGYIATIVSGVVVRRNGVDTGARPGALVRGK